jgi:hypothetical protein
MKKDPVHTVSKPLVASPYGGAKVREFHGKKHEISEISIRSTK